MWRSTPPPFPSRQAAPGLRQGLGRADPEGPEDRRGDDVVDVVVDRAAHVPQEAPLDGTRGLGGRDRIQIIGSSEQPARECVRFSVDAVAHIDLRAAS